MNFTHRSTALLFAALLASGPSAQGTTDGRPRGIYSMGPAPTHDFVDGGVVALPWSTGETAPGVYDFSSVDSSIAHHEALGKRMTLINFVWDVPADLLADPAVVKWTHPQAGTQPVPWDPIALARWRAYAQALSSHRLPSSALGGALVELRKHPTLAQVGCPVLGLQGLRIINGSASSMTGYTRTLFTSAMLDSVHAMRDRFAGKHGYLAVFPMNDGSNSPPLTDHLRAALLAEFDGVRHPLLGFFQENWSAHRDQPGAPVVGWPDPSSGQGLNDLAAKPSTFVMFQATQGWNCPFRNPANVANAEVQDGIAWANSIYDCTYFEVYRCDLDDQTNWVALRALATQLRAAPHEINRGAATLFVNDRTGFAPLAQGGVANLEVLGRPGSLAAVVLGAVREPTGLGTTFGLLDLDPALGFVTAIAGVLPPTGSLTHAVPIPSISLSGLGFQAAVADAGGGVTLTARTTITVR
ncbi:MAG: hypothetical protein HZB39_09720 [Planctomycetes bacterium]|nr:hypothetical protein [Planctomycetota bacterium]